MKGIIMMSDILEDTRFIMKKYKIRANKSLGQNFLINQDVVDKIVESSDITKQDLVIEIGPGLGTLTKELLKKAGKVICIELDKKMIKIPKKQKEIKKKTLQVLTSKTLKI